jgi:uncharacterized protein (DUF1501 family)
MSKSNSDSQAAFQARRNLLKLGTCGAMTNATFLSTLMQLKMTSAVMADAPVNPVTGGYKALVCLFFNGAIDSFNVLAPHGTTQGDVQYAGYRAIRNANGAALKRNPDLGFSDGTVNAEGSDGYLIPIVDSSTGVTYGLHQRLPNLAAIYNAGDATFCRNTGSLVQPIANNTAFSNGANLKPVGLYSHPDQQRHWQTAAPLTRNQVQGWAGKMLDLVTSSDQAAVASNVFTAISTAGQSILLTGNRIVPYSIAGVTGVNANQQGGAVLHQSYGTPPGAPPNNAYDRIFRATQTDLASQTYADVLEQTIKNERLGAKDAALAFQGAYSAAATSPTPLPGNFATTGLSSSLAAVARAIRVAKNATTAPLQQQRQVFLVQVGGWDHHASLLTNQNNMLPAIDNGLKSFYDFLVADGLLDSVTLFSISDFARTLSFNGSGSDHAWGANTIVMGGAVKGGRMYGTYPNFDPAAGNSANSVNTGGNGLDRGRGVLIPTTSSDRYMEELCKWFGVSAGNMTTVLPGLPAFNSMPALDFLD